MEEKDNKVLEEPNTDPTPEVVDENKAIIDELKAKHELEMAEQKTKYSNLLKAYTQGERSSTEEPQEPTEADLEKQHIDNMKALKENNLTNLESAKKLLAVRQYRLDHGEQDMFLPTDGTPDVEDQKSAQKTADLLQHAIDTSNGDENVFTAVLMSGLKDNIKIRK